MMMISETFILFCLNFLGYVDVFYLLLLLFFLLDLVKHERCVLVISANIGIFCKRIMFGLKSDQCVQSITVSTACWL